MLTVNVHGVQIHPLSTFRDLLRCSDEMLSLLGSKIEREKPGIDPSTTRGDDSVMSTSRQRADGEDTSVCRGNPRGSPEIPQRTTIAPLFQQALQTGTDDAHSTSTFIVEL